MDSLILGLNILIWGKIILGLSVAIGMVYLAHRLKRIFRKEKQEKK